MQRNIHYMRDSNEPYKPRPGDKVYRVPRMLTQRITLPKMHPIKPIIGVSLLSFVYGFAAMIAVGTVLLMLPLSSNSGQFTSFVDCLFTSTSAVCVTGLVVVDTLDHWSLFGQAVILILVQLGGLGFMLSTTLLLIAAGRKIGLRSRILVGESVGVSQIGGVVRLARNIILFTLISELVGAIIFYTRFSSESTWPVSIWQSVFHAISAFNNAGFEIFGRSVSLMAFSDDYLVLLTTAVLIILGGISFVVVYNIYRNRGLHHSSVDTKLVLLISLILLALGTLVVLATEYNSPDTLGSMPLHLKILNSFFQSVTARSCGFHSIDTNALIVYTLFFIMILMYIGGSTGSTAGGIKVNTFGLIVITVWNTIRGKEHPGAFGREFSVIQIFRAMTLLVISLGIIALVFFVLSITENFSSIEILFETVSAVGTVGLSTGVTPGLSVAGKVIIAITMFIGRLGPLTLIMALAGVHRASKYHYPQDSVRIG
jgi:trk system potassium uptake protein